ncbi:MAG TPA: response regulator, partial [Verrucomicrobiae bacterium]|nr:response regulator [Verrucomicrobiae bacterium]
MRIAIVNDMAFAVEAMRRVLLQADGHELAWVARDGFEAVQRCAQDTPDLVLMDLIMPEMDGIEAT